ncbi:MAG: zinc-dependent alcohol dehydrogenase family protein [Bradyrhizobiaceae bacterium]|nr:zinc-dependent alcohol dehydrogenase family protein [Bradyrhizobiaceae bacterium]
MKIRAAVLHKMGVPPPWSETKPVSVETIDLDGPGPGEVLVKVAAAGLCHSDLSIINGSRPRPMPMVIGHEAAGVVEEPGPGVGDLQKGDHVIFVFMPSCGHCVPCSEGRPALCDPGLAANIAGTLISGARRLKRNGEYISHQVGVSSFAEYAVVSRNSLVKVDAALPLDVAALFGCAVLTGMGAVVNAAGVTAGSTVGIVGLGGVGLSALLGALAAGASRVVAVDLLDNKLALARQLGASDAFSAQRERVVDEIREATKGGLEYVVETAGEAAAMDIAYRITRRGGTTVTIGLPPPDAALSVPLVQMVAEERTVKGSYIGSSVPVRDLPRYIALYQQGRLPIDRLLTDRLTLDDINLGFERLRRGDAVRQVVVF